MKAIIETTGGLGDNLQKSTIPRMLTESGYEVYVNYTYEDRFIHNPEILRLVWEMNPYVRGFTEEEPNLLRAGGAPNLNNDFIKNWESFYGLIPTNSYPEIYYKPKKIEGIDVAVDLSWLSGDYTIETVKKTAERLLMAYKDRKCKQILSKYQISNTELDIDKIQCDTIFELTDALFSAKIVITLSSGSHMLSAAIHKGTIMQFCIMPDWLPEFPHYRLPNIQYIYPNNSVKII